jgi:hypothetical protein
VAAAGQETVGTIWPERDNRSKLHGKTVQVYWPPEEMVPGPSDFMFRVAGRPPQ